MGKGLANSNRAVNNKITTGLLKTASGESGYRKAAQFLLLLGKERAAEVLKHLEPDEIEKIVKEIAFTEEVDKGDAEKLLTEFDFLKEKIRLPRGGIDRAKEILLKAFGEGKAGELLKKAVPYEGRRPFDFLNDLEDEQIMLLLKGESHRVISLILTFLEPQKASRILSSLEPETQKQVARRIATMQEVDFEVIASIEEKLRERIRSQGRIVTEEIDGRKRLVEILKYMNSDDEERIIRGIAEKNLELSREIKDKLFTIEDILMIDDQDLQKILNEFSDQELALLLKGKSEEVKDKILSNISARRRSMVEEEYLHLGAVRKSEVDKFTVEFVQYLYELWEEGKITRRRADDRLIE